MNWCVLFGSLNRKPVGRVLSLPSNEGDTTHAKVLSTGEATSSDVGSDLDVLVWYKMCGGDVVQLSLYPPPSFAQAIAHLASHIYCSLTLNNS